MRVSQSSDFSALDEERLAHFRRQKLPGPEAVRRSFGNRRFRLGSDIFKAGLVTEFRLVGLRLEGTVRGLSGPFHCIWEARPSGRLHLECNCRQRAYCEHQVALYLTAFYCGEEGPHPEQPPAVGRNFPAEIHTERTSPHLRLDAKDGCLHLIAELKGRSSPAVWPVDGVTVRRELEDGIYYCERVVMRAVHALILSQGFQPLSRPGHFELADPARIDSFLSSTLRVWQGEFNLCLGAGLASVLEAKDGLTSRLSVSESDSIDWFELAWDFEYHGQVLSREDIGALSHFLGRYFRTRDGRIITVDSGRVRAQLQTLKEIGYSLGRQGAQPIPLHFLARAVEVGGWGQRGKKALRGVKLSPRLKSLHRRLTNFQGIEKVAVPEHLKGTLRPYQRAGVDFLHFLFSYRLGGILADEMGLGKTLQVLTLLEILSRSQGHRPSLVICPTSVAPHWIQQAKQFTPGLTTRHLQSGSDIRNCRMQDVDVLVASYGLIRRSSIGTTFRALILDEAQNIKNPKTRTARAVKSLKAAHRLILTGTPIENSLTELWSLFDFLMPGFMGTLSFFQEHYARPIEKERDGERMARLSQAVRPFILRRLKSKVEPDLPPKIEQNIYCEMTAEQTVLYREMVASLGRELSREISCKGWQKSRIHVLAALMRLRQVCCHPSLWDRRFKEMKSGKLNAFLNILNTILEENHRLVVFSQFVKMLKILMHELQKAGIPFHYLDGATRNRKAVVDRFQKGRHAGVFLVSLKAGGTGLNLTAADYVVLFDPWWNPAVESQAIDRVHRIGQDHSIIAYRLLTRGTVEEKMLQLKSRKQDLADRVLGSQTEFFKSLTRKDLDFLLRG